MPDGEGARRAVAPWPNAAQRAAARAAADARQVPRRRFALVGGRWATEADTDRAAVPATSPTGRTARSAGPPRPRAPAELAGPPLSVEAPVVPSPARPRVEPDDDSLLGLTRRSNGRWGSRLFTWFFVFVFLLILAQLVIVLLDG